MASFENEAKMTIETAQQILDRMIETLASIEHERWSHWQSYLHSCGTLRPDGALVLPADLIERWSDQMRTEYPALSEEEKESDREQVRRYLPIIAAAFADEK
jgi:hypothetical protein